MNFPPLDRLIREFAKFPGVGSKSAGRLAFHILDMDDMEVAELMRAVREFKEQVGICPECGCLAEGERCPICTDSRRDGRTLCVVETVKDLISVERTAQFKGIYQVLGGSLAPLDGVGPDELQIGHLVTRLRRLDPGVEEIILATNPTIEGDATAHYLAELLRKNFPHIAVSRIAHGIPTGGELEFADLATLGRSLSDRRPY